MISILVPVYNVEQYLQRCIDSVLVQEFKDWELILVDDGSTDRCPAICDSLTPIPTPSGEGRSWVSEDGKVKTIHKENGGLPSARLAGFREAKGEFLVFLDSDDWLLPGALQTLYDTITSDGGYDIVRTRVKRVLETGEEWLEHHDIESGTIDSSEEYRKAMQNDRMAPYLHSAIYRKALFDENSFLPVIENRVSVGEDWFTNYAISPRVHRLKFIETPSTAYFLNSASMMGGSIYGWEYLERLRKCHHQINQNIGFVETDEYKADSMLGDLKYFFVPEIPFRMDEFRQMQPWLIKAIERGEKWYNPHYGRFIQCAWAFYLYANLYKLLFWVFKLKCHSRKVIK